MTPRTLVAVGLVAGLLGCSDVEDPLAPPGFTIVEGQVRYTPIEGGCWLLHATNDTIYQGVPTALRINTLHVRAAVRVRQGDTYCPGLPAEYAWVRALP